MHSQKTAQGKPENYDEDSQKGAFVSVLFVGGFIALLYILFLRHLFSQILKIKRRESHAPI
ncbi:hypothetical protein RWE15_18850 [Virgibacillus halophilus]|uniref:Uncharacterized protein n=1 Tax=Tigheibacillus halophilus TaxID=361280 RepID=A0ABU5C9N6_9BACI|nr:hypothetical protein [Virgibacillus halophilus]